MRKITLLCCLLAGACGDDDVGPAADAPLLDAAADGARLDAGPSADAAPPSAYEGSWAMREILATVVQAPIVGPVNDRAVTVARVTATVQGDGVELAVTICDMKLETDNTSLLTALLPGYAASMEELAYHGEVGTGMLEATGEVQLQGLQLTQPATETLPTEASDPRVVDADGDAHPGFTVVANVTGLGEVRMYMVQRTRRDLAAGGFTSPDRIEGGLVIHQFEQSVLGATNTFFATTPAIAPNEPGSSFTMVRSTLDCAGILGQDETTLFGPRP